MKKTLLYLLILAVLGTSVWYIFFNEKSIFSNKDAAFTIKDTGSIGKIYLVTKGGESLTLQRDASNVWMVNQKYKARKASIDQLIQALQYQIAEYPVSEQMHNTVVDYLSKGHVKVEVYNRDGEKIRTFFVGGETPSGAGTFMIMDGGSRPYVVNIPGFSGFLTPRYMPKLNDWRDRSVFAIDSANIAEIKLSYPGEASVSDFVIHKNANNLSVDVEPLLKEGKQLNERRVKDYLSFYQQVYGEQVMNGLSGVREMISQTPLLCTIEVKDKSGKTQDAAFYYMPLNRRSKNLTDENDTSAQYDIDRLYAVINKHQDTLLVQNLLVGKLFRMAHEFYQEDTPQQQPTQQ